MKSITKVMSASVLASAVLLGGVSGAYAEDTGKIIHGWGSGGEAVSDTSTGKFDHPTDFKGWEPPAPKDMKVTYPDDNGEEPTDPPTDEPTDPPTDEPTDPPTEDPTTPPTEPVGKDDKNCEVAKTARDAKKVIMVDGAGGANASVTTCEKGDDGFYDQAKTYDGHVGYNGIAAKGAKVEGDGKTPSGVYSMDFGFGVKSKPSEFSNGDYVQVGADDVWIDGNATKEQGYNTLGKKSKGDKGESMNQVPSYNYGQVIDYNSDRVPGKGSAIFLHVHTNSGKTAGCVSVSESELKEIFKWEGAEKTKIDIRQ